MQFIITQAELILVRELAVKKRYHLFTTVPKYINIKLSIFGCEDERVVY